MKEFKKWDKEVCENCDERRHRRKYKDLHCISCTTLKKQGWRAALEWMLSQERSICYSIPVVPTDIIRKELEDED